MKNAIAGRLRRAGASQILQDRTIGPLIARTGANQVRQRPPHGLQIRDLGIDLAQVLFGHPLYIGAGAALVAL